MGLFRTRLPKVVALAVVGAGIATSGLSLSGIAHGAGTYAFDQGHTEVMASWNHLGMSTQTLEFTSVDGSVVFDEANVSNSALNVTIDAKSVSTGYAVFDDHIQAGDFFDTANHPTITFVSTRVEKTGERTGRVTGDLTIKGITKPATLDVTFVFGGEHPLSQYVEAYKGAQYASFSATGTVKRSDYSVDKFAPAVSDEIEIVINTEMRLQ